MDVTNLGGDLYTFRSQIGVTDSCFCPNVTQSDAEGSCCCFSVVKRAEVAKQRGRSAVRLQDWWTSFKGELWGSPSPAHPWATAAPHQTQQLHCDVWRLRCTFNQSREGPARDLSQGRMKGEAEASAKQRLIGANRTGQAWPSNWRDLY